MTPQDQDQTNDALPTVGPNQPTDNGFTPSPDFSDSETPSQSSDAESLQAIESLESEDSSAQIIEPPVETPLDSLTAAPVENDSAVAGVSDSQPYTPNVEPPVPTEQHATSPIEASAAGLAAAAGAQAGSSFGAQQVPSSVPRSGLDEPKKKSKVILIVAVALLAVAAGVAAFYYWQSTQETTIPSDTTTTQTGGNLPGGSGSDVKVDAQVVED